MNDFFKDLFKILILILTLSGIFLSNKVFADPPDNTKGSNLLIKIGDDGEYEEGDVLVAINSKRALSVNAQNIISSRFMPRTSSGTIRSGGLLEKYLEEVMEYKFERIGDKTVRRTNLWTSEVDIISDVPNSSGEYLDVPLYIKRRITLNPGNNDIFGNEGSEYWYGGRTRITDAAMDTVWEEIESRTGNSKNNNFPFTETEKNRFLIIKTDDLTDSEAKELTAPLLDEDGNILKQRKNKININAILNANERANLGKGNANHDIRSRKINNILSHVISK